METDKTLKSWKLFFHSAVLGPFFLTLYLFERRRAFPAAWLYAVVSLLLMLLCAGLNLSFTISPVVTRIGYGVLFLIFFGLAYTYSWVIASKSKVPEPGPKTDRSLSRAFAWTVAIVIIFSGLSNIVQALYYWLLGEQIAVYFSSHFNIFNFWLPIGMIFGFIYGIHRDNDYYDRNLHATLRSLGFTFWFILVASGLILILIIYPLQRLAPIAYRPETADFLFYLMMFLALSLSVIQLLKRTGRYGFFQSAVLILTGIPLIAIHAVIVSGYAVTISLTAASILEDRQELHAAKTVYEKIIPHVRHDHLLAALYHRQGVLHVLNENYEDGLDAFKKVIADYSDQYDVYGKAKQYLESYENRKPSGTHKRRILSVQHRTFEQAASCFPNSLSVILNFYEDQPISTRELSYAIKESFSEGTFIWKAESFLNQHGYNLLTGLWLGKQTLISLIDAGYPVLLFVPGHVMTVYGYDSQMEVFFTYDTAQLNRWSDKPYLDLQKHWMYSGFLMSVVVPKDRMDTFQTRYPAIVRSNGYHRLWQKAQITNYYESKGFWWKDYDQYELTKELNRERMKISDPGFWDDDFYPFAWDERQWQEEFAPLLTGDWAIDWWTVQRFLYYLIAVGQPDIAKQLIDRYELNIREAGYGTFPDLLKMKLAVSLATQNQTAAQSVADELIGTAASSYSSQFYWGHFIKGRLLSDAGKPKEAIRVLLNALSSIHLQQSARTPGMQAVIEKLLTLSEKFPALVDPEDKQLIDIARISVGYPSMPSREEDALGSPQTNDLTDFQPVTSAPQVNSR